MWKQKMIGRRHVGSQRIERLSTTCKCTGGRNQNI